MVQKLASDLEEFFTERADGTLRSIVMYEEDEFEVAFLREDVAELYSEQEVVDAVDESRMQSLAAPIYEGIFSEGHGDLTCIAQTFETVIEMNFVLADGIGVAVALDAEAMEESHGIVSDARDIVEERKREVSP